MTCGKGHQYQGDENYRARRGWCPHCFRQVQARYERSDKARARHDIYNRSDKGETRKARYLQSPKGWKQALEHRRRKALGRRAVRVTD